MQHFAGDPNPAMSEVSKPLVSFHQGSQFSYTITMLDSQKTIARVQ